MEEKKISNQPLEIGDEELDQVAGGLPDKHSSEYFVNGNFSLPRACAQCGTVIMTPTGVQHSELFFCSETCYEEYQISSER